MSKNKKLFLKIVAIVIALSLFVAIPVYSQFFIISNDYPTDQQMDYIKKCCKLPRFIILESTAMMI